MKKMVEKTDKKINSKLRKLNSFIEKDIYKLTSVLIIVLLIILVINLGVISIGNFSLNKKAEEIKEFNKPVKIQLSIIGCNGCFDVSKVVDSVKKQNVDITEEKSLSIYDEETKGLISKYEIKNLPVVLIFGEIDTEKINFNNFKRIEDALVLEEVNAPYLELFTNEIKGEVKIIEFVDSSCEKCISLSSIPQSLAEAGVFLSDWKKVEYNSEEGQQLVNKFGVGQIPALLISEDIDYYPISQSLAQLGLENKQGFYAMHTTIPPYRDLASNKITGLVELIMLKDETCSSCYDINVNKQILDGFGISIYSEKTYDINSNEGKSLISKYNVKKVPIIIVSSEAKYYESFVNAWKQVGSVENDGWYVMRKPEVIGEIRDI